MVCSTALCWELFVLPRERALTNTEQKIVLWVKLSMLWLARQGLSTFFEHVQSEPQSSVFCAHKWVHRAGAFQKKTRLASPLLSSPLRLPPFQSFYQCLYHTVVLPLCFFIHNTRMHSQFPRRMTLNKGKDVEGFVSSCCFPSVKLSVVKMFTLNSPEAWNKLVCSRKMTLCQNFITFSPFQSNSAMTRLLWKIC